MAAVLRERREEALLCRDLSRLRADLPLRSTLADLAWHGADRTRVDELVERLGDDAAAGRIRRWAGE